jgi:hypothetical protein
MTPISLFLNPATSRTVLPILLVLDQESRCTAGIYLAQPGVGSCDVMSWDHRPSHGKLSQLAAFQADGPECGTPEWSTSLKSCLSIAYCYYIF